MKMKTWIVEHSPIKKKFVFKKIYQKYEFYKNKIPPQTP
jgi:hypothetical protein